MTDGPPVRGHVVFNKPPSMLLTEQTPSRKSPRDFFLPYLLSFLGVLPSRGVQPAVQPTDSGWHALTLNTLYPLSLSSPALDSSLATAFPEAIFASGHEHRYSAVKAPGKRHLIAGDCYLCSGHRKGNIEH